MPIFGPPDTLKRLATRFPYVFDAVKPLPGTSKPEATARPLEPWEKIKIGDASVLAIPVEHGPMLVYGYRIGELGYITDAKTLSPRARAALKGVKVLVLNALFPTVHPTHLSIPESVAMAQEIGAERTYFTHLTHRSAHAELERELPAGIAPAHDGLTVTI